MAEDELIKIYKDAYNYFYSTNLNKDQKSLHWKQFDSRNYNIQNLTNFRLRGSVEKSLSRGLDGNDGIITLELFAETINDLSEEYILRNTSKKNIGNCDQLIKYKNHYIDYGKLINIHWFHTIENLIFKEEQINNICEIGGGYGSFAELFIQNYNTKVFLIDLPEANLMATYYLNKNFPEKKFYLFNDYKKNEFFSYDDFVQNDIIILPPNLKIDPKIKFDLFINTRSMMEMNFSTIKSYFNFIHDYSHKTSYFLNINRYEKIIDGKPIRFTMYPYDDNWKVLKSKGSFNQKFIHFLLLQRNFKKNEQNIKDELEKIEIIGKKTYFKNVDYNNLKKKILLKGYLN